MTTARVQRWGTYAYMSREAYDDEPVRAAVVRNLVDKARRGATNDGLVVLEDREHTVHTQSQLLSTKVEPEPAAGIPWVEGDIIPDGYAVLYGIFVTVAAYDPQEGRDE